MTIADDGLRRIVQNHLRKANGWLWSPLETGTTIAGVPDSFWAHEPTRSSGWIEHKATNGWAVTIRPHQVAWIEKHTRAGVHCLFLVRAKGVGSAHGKGDSLWAIHGRYARELSMTGLSDIPKTDVLGYWSGPPADWNWRALQQILIQR